MVDLIDDFRESLKQHLLAQVKSGWNSVIDAVKGELRSRFINLSAWKELLDDKRLLGKFGPDHLAERIRVLANAFANSIVMELKAGRGNELFYIELSILKSDYSELYNSFAGFILTEGNYKLEFLEWLLEDLGQTKTKLFYSLYKSDSSLSKWSRTGNTISVKSEKHGGFKVEHPAGTKGANMLNEIWDSNDFQNYIERELFKLIEI